MWLEKMVSQITYQIITKNQNAINVQFNANQRLKQKEDVIRRDEDQRAHGKEKCGQR